MEKLNELEGKVALITGSMSGIGLEIAKLFLHEKLKGLILLDIAENDSTVNELKSINNSVEIIYRKCDTSNAQNLTESYNYGWNHFGYIHVAVHSAGTNDEDNHRRTININVAGIIDGSMWLWNKMRRNAGGEGGTIININSTAGILGVPLMPIYSATNQAARCFSECLGSPVHYEKTGVRVLVVCPGLTQTAMSTNPTRPIAKEIEEDLEIFFTKFTYQKAESAAKVILEVYQNAASGTVWVSQLDLPAIQHTPRDKPELIEAYFSK